MECMKCKATMFQAKLTKSSPYGGTVYLMNKKEGLLESKKRSDIACFVCPSCGYIELKATDPEKLKSD